MFEWKAQISMPIVIASVIAALLPLMVPLARNFEYEYTSLNAYLSLFLIPLCAIWPRSITPKDTQVRFDALAVASNLAVGILLFQLLQCRCSRQDFFLFWTLQTLPHILLSLAAARFIRGPSLSPRQMLQRYGMWLLCLALLGIAMASILWFMPQKRGTFLLAGFIHGAIYDNWIPLDPGVIWARTAHACLGLSVLSFYALSPPVVRKLVCPLLLLVAIVCFVTANHWPSQSHGLNALLTLMPESRQAEGFILHYQKPSNIEDEIRTTRIFQSARFHSKDLMGILGIQDPAVHIFIYPTQEAKKIWFGGDQTDVTDVLTPSVHITLDEWPHPTLRHELVHAISSRFAFHGLGFHPNMAFTEGLAVALAPEESDIGLHEGAAEIIKQKRLTHIERLFSPLFWSESGPRAYTAAGSLLAYLLQTSGLNKIKNLYAGESWPKVFGSSAEQVLDQWQKFLAGAYPNQDRALQAEALYRHPGLLGELCPHSKAVFSRSKEAFLLELRRPSAWEPGRDYWPWRASIEKDPRAELAVFKLRARKNIESEARIQLQNEVLSAMARPPKILEDVELFILATDLRISIHQVEEARKDLRLYLEQIKQVSLSDQLLRQLWVRYLLLETSDPASKDNWLASLSGLVESPHEARSSGASWVEAYLYLRNTKVEALSLAELSRLEALSLPPGLPIPFRYEWWKVFADRYYQKGEWELAIAALTKAQGLAGEGRGDYLSLLIKELKTY